MITTDPSSSSDPTLDRALDLIESGTRSLEEGDLDAARGSYKDSLGVKETSGGWFNLGVRLDLSPHPTDQPDDLLGLRVSSQCDFEPSFFCYRGFPTLTTREENPRAAIEAWEKSIALSPSADAYTSASDSPKSKPSMNNIRSRDERSGFRTRPLHTTSTCSGHQALDVSSCSPLPPSSHTSLQVSVGDVTR